MNPIATALEKVKSTTNIQSDLENKELHEVLTGEISAIETYKQVLGKIDSHPEAQVLRNMLNDHKSAENFWRNQLKSRDDTPEMSSGAWGEIAQAFIGTAKVLGDNATLLALKKGEEYGLSQYEKLLENKEVNMELREKINTLFVPNQKKHIEKINSLIKN